MTDLPQGENKLKIILANLSPSLSDDEYIFYSTKIMSKKEILDLKPMATIQENEGITLVVLKETAELNFIPFNVIFKVITLGIHSSLTGVGLTSVISNALTKNGISSNVIAGYFHDHFFVKSEVAQKAMEVLSKPLESSL